MYEGRGGRNAVVNSEKIKPKGEKKTKNKQENPTQMKENITISPKRVFFK